MGLSGAVWTVFSFGPPCVGEAGGGKGRVRRLPVSATALIWYANPIPIASPVVVAHALRRNVLAAKWGNRLSRLYRALSGRNLKSREREQQKGRQHEGNLARRVHIRRLSNARECMR
jgi:hypothetical protein